MKKILGVLILSIISFSSISQEFNTQEKSVEYTKKSSKENYLFLNNEISKLDNSKNKEYFDNIYKKESKNNEEKIKEIIEKNSVKDLSPNDNLTKKEMRLWTFQNLISVSYIRSGFLQAAKEKGTDETFAIDAFNNILSDNFKRTSNNILNNENKLSINNNIFNYNKAGLSIDANETISLLNNCKPEDIACLQKIISKIENEYTTDIFKKLTQKCISKDYQCRIEEIRSESFKKDLNYRNYLLGMYLFQIEEK